MSGKNKPYDPDPGAYPEFAAIALPSEPDTIWNTLFEPIKVWTLTSFELSVNSNKPPEPDNFILKVPGNNFSLYLALSTDNAQKSFGVNILLSVPYEKFVFSSSKTKVLYWP